MAAPGASLRWLSAATAAIPQLQQLAGQNGLKLGTAGMPAGLTSAARASKTASARKGSR